MNRHAYAFAALFTMAASSAYGAVPVLGDPPGPNGSDDFSDSAASANNWLAATPMGGGVLSIIDQHLAYTTPQPATDLDFDAWQWNRNGTPDHTDWTFQLDVSVPQLSLTDSQYVLYGLQVSTSVGGLYPLCVRERRHDGIRRAGVRP